MLRRVLTGLTVAISLGAILTLTTTPSHAVPVAGDYTITGLITGTFHSDGTRLTTWEFTDSFNMIWTPACGTGCITEQTPQYFDQRFSNSNSDPNVPFDFREIYIVWDRALRPDVTVGPPPEYYAASDDRGGAQHNSGVVVVVPSSVPEPSSALLLLAELGLLAGYGVWQRRQAGLQIG